MSEKTNKIKNWFKKNKKKIIITSGVAVISVVCTILVIKNKEMIISGLKKFLCKGNFKNRNIKLIKSLHKIDSNVINESAPIKFNTLNVNIIDETPTKLTKEITVSGHPRNLSGNRHASPQKIQEAFENGIILKENQTYVSCHMRKVA